MTPAPVTPTTATNPDDRELLRASVALLGAHPFLHAVVQSPWNNVSDAESLRRSVKENIRHLIQNCRQPEAQRCLTIVGPPGYGKTHLLAWTRAFLETRDDTVFVLVPPWRPEGANPPAPEQHLMRATIDALWSQSQRQQQWFCDGVRGTLVSSYDGVVVSGRRIRETLRTGTFWQRNLFPSRLRIGERTADRQIAAIRRAFARRAFIDQAFADFCRRHPAGGNGVRPDRDAFVAAALRTCGDTRQAWHADRWFNGDRLPPDVWQPFHLDRVCEGTACALDSLFALQRLIGRSFCFAFDQLEATSDALLNCGAGGDVLRAQWAGLLQPLCEMPGFALLFACQESVWNTFSRQLQPMLVQRMTAGYGAQLLPELTDSEATDLIRARLQAAVWDRLSGLTPPADSPYYPFTPGDIRSMRLSARGALRDFLGRAALLFNERINTIATTPASGPRLRLTGVEPPTVLSHESTLLTIRGESLPANVVVSFGGTPPTAAVCRQADGVIEATAPPGLRGEVEVRVTDAEDGGNTGMVRVCGVDRAPPARPYAASLSRRRFRARRNELNLTLKDVERKTKIHYSQLSRFETGKWATPSDDVFERLAACYGLVVNDFAKRADDDA